MPSPSAFFERVRFRGKPIANPDSLVVSDHVRFTVLTKRLLRMEWTETGLFEDRGTFGPGGLQYQRVAVLEPEPGHPEVQDPRILGTRRPAVTRGLGQLWPRHREQQPARLCRHVRSPRRARRRTGPGRTERIP